MLNPYPTRLRSNSTPSRSRVNTNSKYSSSPSSPKPAAATPTPELLLQKRASSPSILPPAPPPRPPRNPARITPSASASPVFPSRRPSSSSHRPSTSSGARDSKPWDSLADLKLLQRRRSTGTKKPLRAVTAKPSNLSSSTSASTSSHSSPQIPSTPALKGPQFSTADRTILEELRRNLSARESQFVIKPGGVRGGKKHHPFNPQEVPYPRSYEREVVDLDVWETAWCQQLCGSPTWHVFEEPPQRVLDIGCGTGAWILDCARLWKNCHFVGLDIVPLHPDLVQLGSPDLKSRITWVQENFLEPLPFPNEEFDFVHIKRIARGVPEDKWDSLFEEITRVMRPGAAFEMIEEDLDFPGKMEKEDSDFDSDSDTDTGTDTNTTNSYSRPRSYAHPHARSHSFPYLRPSPTSPSHPNFDFELNGSPSLSRSNSLSPSNPSSLHSSHSEPSTSATSPPTPPMSTSREQMSTIAEHSESQQGTPHEPLSPDDSDATAISPQEHLTPPPRPHAPEPPSPESVSLSPIQLKPPAQAEVQRPYPPILLNRRTKTEPSKPGPGPLRVQTHALDKSGGANNRLLLQPLSHRPRKSAPASPVSRPDDQSSYSSPVRRLLPLLPSLSTSSLSPSTLLRAPMLRSRSHSHPHANSTIRLSPPSPDSSFSPMTITPSTASTTLSPSVQLPPLTESAKPKPFLLRSLPGKPPRNPRDHTLLEMIYTEMHSARFINLAPLSLLGSSLSTYFKDVRTHPPLVLTFPPSPSKRFSSRNRIHKDWSSTSGSESDGLTHFADPGSSSKSQASPSDVVGLSAELSPGYKQPRFISMEGLLLGASPYVSLDMTRLSALSPYSRTAFPSVASLERNSQPSDLDTPSESVVSHSALPPSAYPSIKARLPNTTMTFDLRTLNMHLALRATEVLASAEAMWEWVVEYQARLQEHGGSRSRSQLDPLKSDIAGLSRTEFDVLLSRFEMDMRDHMALGSAIEAQFGWTMVPSGKTQERKAFDVDCDKWRQYERDQRRRHKDSDSHPYHPAEPHRQQGLLSTAVATSATDTTHLPPLLGDSDNEDGGYTQRPSTLQENCVSSRSNGSIISPSHPHHRRVKTEASVPTDREPLSGQAPRLARRMCRAMRVFVAWKP